MKELVDLLTALRQTKHKVLICGNGGLAAEAEHFTAELMGKFGGERPIPCIALTANTSLITALSNDYGYADVFSHQIVTMGHRGDVLIAMTTTASENIKRAIFVGKQKGMQTVALCGPCSPDLGADLTIKVQTKNDCASIQEAILSLLHAVAWEAKKDL